MGQRRNQRGNENYIQANENRNEIYQSLWGAAKAALRGKFIVTNAYVKKKNNIK